MTKEIYSIVNKCQSENLTTKENAFVDIKFLIERYTQNRYDEISRKEYNRLFHDKELLNIVLTDIEYSYIRNFLYYNILLNSKSEISVLIAKCIKVTYEEASENAIINLIDIFMEINDATTHELILAITDIDNGTCLENLDINSIFRKVYRKGGEMSRNLIISLFEFHKQNFNQGLSPLS